MAQEFSLRYPLINGQGNFGSVDGDGAAAMRYTEARMQNISEELLKDLDKDTVDFVDNYDATKREPSVLPANLPALLINGITGIAVGLATSIPPHNLDEVVDAFIHLIDNPDCEIKDLLKFVKGPDFPTGGVAYGGKEMEQAYLTGRGKVTTRAVANIEEMKAGRSMIVVSEIPYMVNKANLVEKIAALASDKKIVGISDLRDESDREGLRIVIELKRDSFPKKILNQLYKLTQMQVNFNFNMIALVDGIQPRLLNLKEILYYFQEHREVVIVRRTKYELKIAEARQHILEGLKIALDHIDEIIKLIRASATKEEAHVNLMEKYKLSDLQAKAILDMRLQALAGLERKKVEDELEELRKLIERLMAILADRKLVLNIVKEEILEVKERHTSKRRTKMIRSAIDDFTEEDLIPDEAMIVTLTENNYVKRIEPSTYKSQNRGGKGIAGMGTKDDDKVDHIIITRTHHDILFFTDKGRVFKLKTHEIPQVSRTAKGQALINLIQLGSDEKVTAMISLEKDQDDGFLVMATEQGTVKKTALVDFKNVRSSGLVAIKIKDTDALRWVRLSSDTDDMMLITVKGQSIRFTSEQIRPMGRASQGVRGIRLKGDDRVVQMIEVNPGSTNSLMILSENGYGKMTSLDQFRDQTRGGSGIKASDVTKKTGELIGALIVSDLTDDLIVISQGGIVIRIEVSAVPSLGRATQGVRIMKLKDDMASSMTLFKKIDEEEEDATKKDESK
jgi:DNA gyrase subunit A